MSKVAIMTDSNSGITQSQGEEQGIYVIPMPFIISDETYYEDINLSGSEFYEKLQSDADISTTQPAPGEVMAMWDDLLKDYDEIIYIPMSSGLSGACATAMMLACEEAYEGHVFVVDNQRISVTMRQSVLDAKVMADRGMSGQEIHDQLMKTKMESSIYIMVDTLKYLKKGGRITAAAAALGTLLKLKPVLQIQGEKLDAFAKARTVSQAKSIMINAVKADIENRFGGDVNDVWIEIAHTQNEEEAEKFKTEILEIFPDYPEEHIYVDHLSLSVSCHIGPGALAVALTKKQI
ncbi:MAG: DegV family protein [Clostridiales bacterium]|nr:DegV family protein [Clostridiales bacterium]